MGPGGGVWRGMSRLLACGQLFVSQTSVRGPRRRGNRNGTGRFFVVHDDLTSRSWELRQINGYGGRGMTVG